MKSCDVINMTFNENAEIHKLFLQKKNLCDFDLFKLLCDELDFNIRAGDIKSNMLDVVVFVFLYLSMELWSVDLYLN